MAKQLNKAAQRAKARRGGNAEKLAAQRRTAENKARRMFAALKRSQGRDMAAADGLVDLVARFPHLKNLKLG